MMLLKLQKHFPHWRINVLLLQLCIIILIASCNSNNKPHETAQYLGDSIHLQLFNLQDERNTTELLTFFNHPDPQIRKQALIAMGSVQDTAIIQKLFSILLKEQDVEVRNSAAFALGQTRDSLASQLLFDALEQETSPLVKQSILEAIGKCIPATSISKLYLFSPQNEPEKEGLLWGMYYAGIRNVYDLVGVELAIKSLNPEESFDVRHAAAQFLSRLRGLDSTPYLEDLTLFATFEKSPDVRMKIASILGFSTDQIAQNKLIDLFRDVDDRVKINALNAIKNKINVDSLEILTSLLSHPNAQVAVAASDLIIRTFDDSSEKTLDLYISSSTHWRAKRALQKKKMMVFPSDSLAQQLKDEYQLSNDSYDKSAILSIFQYHITSYPFVVTEMFDAKSKNISSSAITCLAEIIENEHFPDELKLEFTEIFKKAIETGDLALVTVSASELANEKLGLLPLIGSTDFLNNTLQNLTNASDVEAIQAIKRLQSKINNEEYTPENTGFNHPLDLVFISGLNDTEYAVIHTSEGDIKIQLFSSEAPGSVANFLNLAASGYYNGIKFHRVVPNFVAQAGCNRGDGWGGLDYTIRSEFTPRKYTTGSVGMASSGKDTEGTQFFITHSSTPHLDGRYTIFAEVMEGMDVVNKLDIGSEILSVERILSPDTPK